MNLKLYLNIGSSKGNYLSGQYKGVISNRKMAQGYR